MPETTSSNAIVESRGFEDLSSMLEDERGPLQSLVQRRLTQALNVRRQARAVAVESPVVNPSNATRPIDPRELLDLLGSSMNHKSVSV